MKEGLRQMTPLEVAAIRMISAGTILIPFALKEIKKIPSFQFLMIVLSGLLGSFFPAILFCVAETKINSALAAMLNSLTPLFVLLTGLLFFKLTPSRNSLFGIFIGLTGMLLLFFHKGLHTEDRSVLYSGYILLATLCYGLNVNIIHTHLKGISSLQIASVAFVSLLPVSIALLWWQNPSFFQFESKAYILAFTASAVLGVFGTAIASILFYMLLKRAGALFSSMVTYGIPVVAVGWGLMANEPITAGELVGLFVILTGVYLSNKKEAV
jgi:drug/metabolite transporter (DMT)-like permease